MTAKFELVAAASDEFEVSAVCAVVGVNRTSYYKWRIKGQRKQEDARSANADTLGEQVEAVFWQHSRRYGTRRIVAELKAAGIKAGRTRVRRLLEERNLRAIQPKSFVPRTTNSKHTLGYSPNLLLEVRLPPSAVNKVIVGDITYLPLLSGGWCYLAMFTDLFSRRIVGWAVRETMSEELVLEAYRMLRQRRRPTRWTIIHSDRGGQYAGRQFRNLLLADKARQSMSRAGETYDNASAESVFSRYKAELLEDGAFRDVEEARLETFNYIEGYYNRIRRHSSLGYLSPEEYERQKAEEKDAEIKRNLTKQESKE